MVRKVDFDEVEDIDKLFRLLAVGEASNGVSQCQFRDWELLREIDRQERRKEYDKSPERLALARERRRQSRLIQDYVDAHPEVVEKVKGRRSDGR